MKLESPLRSNARVAQLSILRLHPSGAAVASISPCAGGGNPKEASRGCKLRLFKTVEFLDHTGRKGTP